jgi:hypothetical protein
LELREYGPQRGLFNLLRKFKLFGSFFDFGRNGRRHNKEHLVCDNGRMMIGLV